MRKRSGAIDSSNLESYVKLATLSQNKDSIFYSNDVSFVENVQINEDSLRRTTSRKWSDAANRTNFPKISTPSASSSVKFRKNSNFDFNWCSPAKDCNNFEKKQGDELSCGRTFSNFSNEEQIIANRITTKQIIVIGASQTGKKSLVHSIFGGKSEDVSSNNECSYKEPSFDLIVKTEDIKENEKIIYKFWIQNLSNETYEKIIDVYYKTMNMFIFVYNVSEKSSFNKIKEQYEHIKSLSLNGNLNCLLIGMHFNPKNKIEVNNEEANEFAEKMNFSGFLVTNKKNVAINRNIYEIIQNNFGIEKERKDED